MGGRRGKRVAVAVVVLALLALWRAGTFDQALVRVGLNAQECARNAFGATFCGDELRDYRRRVVEPLQQDQQRQRREELNELRRENDAAEEEMQLFEYENCLANDPTAAETGACDYQAPGGIPP